MKDPKKYLKTSDRETLDPDMLMHYQRSSTAGASCSNVSPSSNKSFFSRSLKSIAKFFTPSTQEAPIQNVSLNEEDEQQNSIEAQQNIVPQPVQNLQVQQTVQQPIENVQQPAEIEAHPDPQEALHQSPEQPVQAPEQQVKPEEALQHPAQVTQSEREDKTPKEEKVEYK